MATQVFDIGPQPLASALLRFSEATGIQLFFDATLARNVSSPGARGTLSPQDALTRLLAGTGLSYRFTNATTVTLQKATAAAGQPADAVQLAPVVVQGARPETATGPVKGFVAHQSATATKTDTPLLETPQAISVISRDQIRAQNAQTLNEAVHYSPGVASNSVAVDSRFDAIRVRGFATPIYLDGMLLPTDPSRFAQMRVDPFGLERAEILRGPSSALYGQLPPGGMINLVSLRPTPEPVHTVEFQGNSFGRLQAGVDVGGPLTEDGQFLYRLTGLVHRGGTQIDHADDNRNMIQPAITWRPDSDTTLTLLGQFQNDWAGIGTQFLPAQGTLLFNPNGVLPTSAFVGEPNYNSFHRTQFWAGYQFEHRFNDAVTVRQNLRYASVDTRLESLAGAGLQPNLFTLNRLVYLVPQTARNFTMDNQAQVKFATGPLSHKMLLGFDYVYSGVNTQQGLGPAPPLQNIFNPVYGQPVTVPNITVSTLQKQNQYGLYLQDQIALDRWRLTLSGRHDWVDTTTEDYMAHTVSGQAATAFSGRVGLNYVFDIGLSPYVSYSSSFQPTIGTTFSGTPFQPTRGQQYEVGLKYQPPDLNVSANLAAFRLVQQNALTSDSGHPGFTVQSGEVTAQGIEFDAAATLARGFNIIGSYSFLDAKVTQSNGTDLGMQVTGVPQHQGSLWSNFVVQEGRLRGLGFGAGFRYIGLSYGDAANTLMLPGYVLVDAMMSYELGELNPKLEGAKVALNASNLMDTRYVALCTSGAACFYGASRQVTLTLRYSW
ncbi:MAG: TonB-dependent siderophore receptor [Proteobacteria bacterium]|nr:TonB-dependent siderophore receptor [Pseudomonadota bacterium]